MVSSRQEIDLRPQLERLDALILRSAGLDPSALSFEFRPLWQLSAAEKAAVALQKAQATQVYAGLGVWPATTAAKLVEAQLIEDGTYPNAETIFSEAEPTALGDTGGAHRPVTDYPGQPRDPLGQFGEGKLPIIPIIGPHWERERKRIKKREKHREKERERERELEERHGTTGHSDTPGGHDEPLPGNLKRPSMQVLEDAARKAGYLSVEIGRHVRST